VADSDVSLQQAIDFLEKYADENRLTVNVRKTKCLVFHRGRLPMCSFLYKGNQLQLVNNFVF